MNCAEMKIIRFDGNDVIATSVLRSLRVGYQYKFEGFADEIQKNATITEVKTGLSNSFYDEGLKNSLGTSWTNIPNYAIANNNNEFGVKVGAALKKDKAGEATKGVWDEIFVWDGTSFIKQ